MFSTYSSVATIAGAGALSYLAAAPGRDGAKPTLRFSLDKNNSLLGDVRLLGGVLMTGAAMWAKEEKTKKTCAIIALASFGSLAVTEAIRYRYVRAGIIEKAPLMPTFGNPSFGALNGPSDSYGAYQANARQASWAAR